MVAFNPNERPTIDEILNDEWMQEINNLNAVQIDNLENEVRNEFHNREAQIQANANQNQVMMNKIRIANRNKNK